MRATYGSVNRIEAYALRNCRHVIHSHYLFVVHTQFTFLSISASKFVNKTHKSGKWEAAIVFQKKPAYF